MEFLLSGCDRDSTETLRFLTVAPDACRPPAFPCIDAVITGTSRGSERSCAQNGSTESSTLIRVDLTDARFPSSRRLSIIRRKVTLVTKL